MGFEHMTPYEQAALRESVKLLYAPPSRKMVPATGRDRLSGVSSKVSDDA